MRWCILLLAAALTTACTRKPAKYAADVEHWAKEPGKAKLPEEVAALARKLPTLEGKFPGDSGSFERRDYFLWSAARACNFDLKRMQSEFPSISSMALIVLAEKKEDSTLLLTEGRSIVGEEGTILTLFSGNGALPRASSYLVSGRPELWQDFELDGVSFSQFQVETQHGKRYATGEHYYHPFPNEPTWPKYKIWVEIRDGQLIPERIERYTLPSSEKLIKPEYLDKTYLPKTN